MKNIAKINSFEKVQQTEALKKIKMNNSGIHFTDEELLALRQAGRLPRIRIVEDDFIVVWEHKELRMEEDNRIKIDLDNLPLSEDGKQYLAFYNQKTKSIIHIPEDITALPEDTVLLKIPNENFLDPVGVARQFGQQDTFMLDLYPIRTNFKAEVIPLQESGLPELIRTNLEKIQQQKAGGKFHPEKLLKRGNKGKAM